MAGGTQVGAAGGRSGDVVKTLETLATDAKLELVRVLVSSLDGKVATDAVLKVVRDRLGDPAAPAAGTAIKHLADLVAKDFATDAKLELVRLLVSSIDGKVATDTVLQVVRDRIGDTAAPAAGTTNKLLTDLLAELEAKADLLDTQPVSDQVVRDRLGDPAAPAAGTTNKHLADLVGKDFATETTLAKLRPIAKAALFNQAILADTPIFGARLAPTNTPGIFRVYVVMGAAGRLYVERTNDAGVTVLNEDLNGGADLVAGVAYILDIAMDAGEEINLLYSAAATARKLSVMEVPR